jgi:putative transposase
LEATLFVMFRLAGSLPSQVIERLKQDYARQPRYAEVLEQLPAAAALGPAWLCQPALAAAVGEALHFRAGRDYAPWLYYLIANYVHLLLKLARYQLPAVLPYPAI